MCLQPKNLLGNFPQGEGLDQGENSMISGFIDFSTSNKKDKERKGGTSAIRPWRGKEGEMETTRKCQSHRLQGKYAKHEAARAEGRLRTK